MRAGHNSLAWGNSLGAVVEPIAQEEPAIASFLYYLTFGYVTLGPKLQQMMI